MKLYLIRHGQTRANAKKIYVGSKNIPLNATGRRQAARLHRRMKHEKIDTIFSSDLKRAAEFAKIVFSEKEILTTDQLREIRFGLFEGFTHRQLLKKYPQVYQAWLNDPLKSPVPKGENLAQVRRRVRRFIKKLGAANHNKHICLVTHAGPIRTILGDILKTRSPWEIRVDNASLSIIEIKNGKKRILIHNDISFL